MSNISNDPYTGLLCVVTELQDKLMEYAKRPDCSQQYIARQTKVIDSLQEVLSGLEFYSFHPVYTKLQHIINSTLQRDKEIESFQINMNLKPATNKISVININVF